MIYVASSWRNTYQPQVVNALRAAGHEVYDFRDPPHGRGGFGWHQIDPDWLKWTPAQWRDALDHPLARGGFKSDMDALQACEACLLVMPCGRSAHLELGWAAGAGKRTALVVFEAAEPDLMVGVCDAFCTDMVQALDWAAGRRDAPQPRVWAWPFGRDR